MKSRRGLAFLNTLKRTRTQAFSGEIPDGPRPPPPTAVAGPSRAWAGLDSDHPNNPVDLAGIEDTDDTDGDEDGDDGEDDDDGDDDEDGDDDGGVYDGPPSNSDVTVNQSSEAKKRKKQTSQISVLDIWNYLARSKDNIRTHEIENRYAQLRASMRQYAFVRLTKRNGVDPGGEMEAGVLATLCSSCPQPGINNTVPEPPDLNEKKQDEGEDKRRFQKMKAVDPHDKAMTRNGAFFVHEEQAAAILKDAEAEAPAEESTCNKFGAMGYQRYAGTVSGLLAMTCSRHMMTMRNSVVDLTKGEANRFKYADLSEASAIKPYLTLPMLISGYDINCQYHRNYDTRMDKLMSTWSELMECLPSVAEWEKLPYMLIAVGKFHLPAHQASCRYKFSYNYLPGAARTDGEASERMWAAIYQLATRIREMGPGSRHDALNDIWNDQNVRHLHTMSRDLSARYNTSEEFIADLERHLTALEATFSPERLAQLKEQEAAFKLAVVDMANHDSLENIYDINIEQVTDAKDATKSQKARKASSTTRREEKIMQALDEGARLQVEREKLLKALMLKGRVPSSVVDQQADFLKRYAEWSPLWDAHIQPALQDAALMISEEDAPKTNFPRLSEAAWKAPRAKRKASLWKEVYNADIALPSSFHEAVLKETPAVPLVEAEIKIRRDEAREALDEVRTALILSFSVKLSKKHARSKRVRTEISSTLGSARGDVQAAAHKYRRVVKCLLRLGVPPDDPAVHPLEETDLKVMVISAQGDQSWIWDSLSVVDKAGTAAHQRYKDQTEVGFTVESVHWFRIHAMLTRWREERKLLRREMWRTAVFFGFFRQHWLQNAELHEHSRERGKAAYAKKYLVLFDGCKKAYMCLKTPFTKSDWNTALGLPDLDMDYRFARSRTILLVLGSGERTIQMSIVVDIPTPSCSGYNTPWIAHAIPYTPADIPGASLTARHAYAYADAEVSKGAFPKPEQCLGSYGYRL
ncbi:uncharacterized protein BXZ73DRAFT_80823 [Epithele typhae]|uniref:uncharacterized protein n=1 Tax=Epithele typhae TaxID=378194 RepID=UPI002007FAC4|nr:uncharacterized protein BXZ73DRAFT_80823 [Epithele typhae]KAH9917370.1 hypothetical protein BXZ73DRAFT_80823 [Epithele typhae]